MSALPNAPLSLLICVPKPYETCQLPSSRRGLNPLKGCISSCISSLHRAKQMHCSDAPVMNYSAAIKQISDSLPAPEDAAARVLALCNRAYCYQQLSLHRKAIKVGQHVLDCEMHRAPWP